jgi:iron complex outermembrane recepter protein
VNSEAVDLNGDGENDIQVRPGNRIPGLPENTLKLRADYDLNEKFSVGANVIYASSIFARGDENNQDERGKVPGYTVVNLDARYRFTKQLEIFGRINNVLDKEYETFGILAENAFANPAKTLDLANAQDEQFRGPGAPRGIWIGLRYDFGAPAAARKDDDR